MRNKAHSAWSASLGIRRQRKTFFLSTSRIGRDNARHECETALQLPQAEPGLAGAEVPQHREKACDERQSRHEGSSSCSRDAHSKEYAIGTEKFSRVLLAWENLPIDNFQIQGSNTGSADRRGALPDAFLAIMVALNGIPAGESYGSDTSIGGIFWYKRHGTGALMERDLQFFEDVEYCTMLSQEIADDSWFRAALEGSHKRYVEKLENAVYLGTEASYSSPREGLWGLETHQCSQEAALSFFLFPHAFSPFTNSTVIHLLSQDIVIYMFSM